jgi:cytochrome oxidase assembly protein ShyY1
VLRVLLSPSLIGLHLLALVATTAAVWLGLWQYDAWQASREAEATSLTRAEQKPLDEVMSSDDPFPGDAIGQPVQFAGEWVGDASFLVADRELEDRSGYWVVTPVAVCRRDRCETGPAMLVVRGWIARPTGSPDVPTGRVQVTGWLQPPEDSGRPDPDPGDDVLNEMRIADAIQRVEQDLYGGYVIAEVVSTSSTTGEGSTTGAARMEPVRPASLPEPETFTAFRNLLYAFEWWVFGAFALFVWWRWCADAVGSSVSTSSTTGGGPTTGGGSTAEGSTDKREGDVAEVASKS